MSTASRIRPVTSSIASNQLASRNSPLPFGPVRTSGVRTLLLGSGAEEARVDEALATATMAVGPARARGGKKA